ncbi:MAG TPA: hypothetical protein DCM08_05635 [Microscillaceae bacterium]|nr:hypothetical protein [Microscillaceae bacterium]
MQILQKTAVFLGLLLASHWACGQILKNNELKLPLNEEATHYIKFTFANQVWLRYNESNLSAPPKPKPSTLACVEHASN